MPYDVKEERRADSLMRGARVLLRQSGEPLVVQAAERKTKYTYLTFGTSLDGETVLDRSRYANEDKLTTLREKLTDAEQFERDYERAHEWAARQLTDGLANVPADYLADLAQKWHAGSYRGPVMDWSEGATFFHLQAMYKAWRTVHHTLERLRELYGSRVTPLSALVLELDQRDEDRRNHGVVDPLSRSTNMLSSMLDDLDRWSWEKLADSSRYYIGDTIRHQETVALKDLADARKAVESVDAQ